MIRLANHSRAGNNGTEIPGATSRTARNEREWSGDTALKSYLSKLLDPTEEALSEPTLQPVAKEVVEAAPTTEPQLHIGAHHGRRSTAENEKESRPHWQTADKAPAETPAQTSALPKPTRRCRPPRKRTEGDRQKLMMALIPVLAILLIVVLRNPLGKRPAVKTAGAAPKTFNRPVGPAAEIAWEIPAPFELGGRDPMQWTPTPMGTAQNAPRSAASPAEDSVELIVMGILYSEDRPSAIVNTQLVHEGQQVFGVAVNKIDRDGVQFERNGRKWKQGVNP